jgi:hypothetical protein
MPVTGSRMAEMPVAVPGEVVAIVMALVEVVMAVRKAVTEKSVAEAVAKAVSTTAAFGRGADVRQSDRKANNRNGGDGLS